MHHSDAGEIVPTTNGLLPHQIARKDFLAAMTPAERQEVLAAERAEEDRVNAAMAAQLTPFSWADFR